MRRIEGGGAAGSGPIFPIPTGGIGVERGVGEKRFAGVRRRDEKRSREEKAA